MPLMSGGKIAEDIIKQEAGKDAGVAVIGPAGERLVRFALVENNYWRSAGRAGTGAVLGSKKVKGIVFHGDTKRKVARNDLLDKLWKDMGGKAKTNRYTSACSYS